MADLGFACRCGTVKGALRGVSPANGIRYICHCDDCQAFAWFLEAPGVMDAHAGTDVFQTAAHRLDITQGREHLACVQVTKRPLLRWYCDDCKTPLANTYGAAQWSFLSVILYGFDPAARDGVLGPPSGHVWTQYAKGDLNGVSQCSIPAMIWRILSRMASARLSGGFRRTPLFDPQTGRPIATPLRLTASMRKALDERGAA